MRTDHQTTGDDMYIDTHSTLSAPGVAETTLPERAPRSVTTLLTGKLMCRTGEQDLCRIRNISPGGMLVEAQRPLRLGEALAIELRSGERLKGAVAWTAPGRAGVAFDAPLPLEEVLSLSHAGHGARDRPRPRSPRFDIDSPARLSGDGRIVGARLENISQSGAKLRLSLPRPLSEQLTLAVEGMEPRRCVRRWQDGEGGVGVAFLEVIPFHTLAEWLNQRHERD